MEILIKFQEFNFTLNYLYFVQIPVAYIGVDIASDIYIDIVIDINLCT